MAVINIAKRKAWEKMDESLNAAARARKAIKSGRPKAKAALTTFDAIQRLMDEADRARGLMRKQGLDPGDIRLALIFRTATDIGSKTLPMPAPEEIGRFYESLEAMAAAGPVTFLGIMWEQIDREHGKPERNLWFTEFANDPRGALEMLAFRNRLMAEPEN